MNGRSRLFIASFAITGILIGALCGFAAVDLSTDRYMPDTFGPFFEITSIDSDGLDFRFMAEAYRLESKPANTVLNELSKIRGLLPSEPRIAGHFAGLGAQYAIEWIKNR